jgi:hypothetical protein
MNRIPLLAFAIVVACAGDSVLTGTRSDGVTIWCNVGESYYQCGPEAPPPAGVGGDSTVTPPDTGSDTGSGDGSDMGSGDGSGTGSDCGENFECGGDGSGSDGSGGGSDCEPWPNGPATILWPPNHKLHTYSLADCAGITMCPNGQQGAVDGTVTQITVDEDIDVGHGGDGHTTNYDAKILDATHFDLRSERQGGGDGRVYTVYYTDAAGNAGSCQFLVPHNRGPFEGAVDSGTVVTVLP